MESQSNFQAARAALAWQVELGATEAICEQPVNRFELQDVAPKIRAPASVKSAPDIQPAAASAVDPVAVAMGAAKRAADLQALEAELQAFGHCELKRGAKNTVFADGDPGARVMIIGEAPGRDEDIEGRPFVGRAGQLLDRMFAAIKMDRNATTPAASLYITNIMPWRPPQNRDPLPQEIAMMLPFIERHIELVQPEVLVLMGNISCQALLGQKGITRLRGNWKAVHNLPAMPMFHPAYLLRNPAAKPLAWHDLLMVQAKLRDGR